MRKPLLTVALSAVAIGVAAAPAIAVQTPDPAAGQKFEASMSPSKAGTKKKPRAVKLHVRPFHDTAFALSVTPPFATLNANVWFPKEIVFNQSKFPKCSKTTVLNRPDLCPKNSLVGSGTALGFGRGAATPAGQGIRENLTVQVFNGGGTQLYLRTKGSITQNQILDGKLTKVRGKFGTKLVVTIPKGLVTPAEGLVATLTDFDVTLPAKTIKKGSKRYPFAGLTGCPKSKRLTVGYTSQYTDGTPEGLGFKVTSSSNVSVKVKCRR